MIRFLVVLFLVLGACVVFALFYKAPQIFSPDDARALGIKIDMELEDVEKVLGKPVKRESHFEGAFGADVISYYYRFGSIRLEPLNNDKYTVSAMTINEENFAGPRNTRVGDSLQSVLGKFPANRNAIIDSEGKKYLYGKGGAESYGFLMYESGRVKYLLFSYGGGGFGSYSLGMDIVNKKVAKIWFGVMNV